MKTFYTVGRLLWRPAVLGLLFLVALSAAVTVIAGEIGRTGMPVTEPSFFGAVALWGLSAGVPAAVGVALGIITAESQPMSTWTLPRFREAWFSAKIVAAAVVGMAAGAAVARIEGTTSGLAAFGLASMSFALGGAVVDPVVSKLESRAALLLLVVLVFRPDYPQWVALEHPLLLMAAGTVLAVVLVRREFSAEFARRRPFIPAAAIGITSAHTYRAYWAATSKSTREWITPLHDAHLGGWLRAANYESFGGARGPYIRMLVMQYIVLGFVSYYLRQPDMVAWIPAMVVSWAGLELRAKFLYPLSRTRRARIAYWASLLEISTISALATVTLTLLYALGVQSSSAAEQTLAEVLPLVLFVFMWAPLGQFARLKLPMRAGVPDFGVKTFAALMAWLTLALLSHFAYTDVEPFASLPHATKLAAIASLMVITQVAYWLALRWHYARADLGRGDQ